MVQINNLKDAFLLHLENLVGGVFNNRVFVSGPVESCRWLCVGLAGNVPRLLGPDVSFFCVVDGEPRLVYNVTYLVAIFTS